MSYWHKKTSALKDKFIETALWYQYLLDHPEEMAKEKNKEEKNANENFAEISYRHAFLIKNLVDRIYVSSDYPSVYSDNISVPYDNCLNHNRKWPTDIFYDDENGKKCTIYFSFKFQNFLEMQDFIKEKVPLIFEGWNDIDGKVGYGGNSLLAVCDAVTFIQSPLYGGKRTDGKTEYKRCKFNVCIGFSKQRWNRLYKEYLRQKK